MGGATHPNYVGALSLDVQRVCVSPTTALVTLFVTRMMWIFLLAELVLVVMPGDNMKSA
tara:strand:+ start:1937 stop:2113 length:177 start_codon:yes stop_codon:yes gene_type:complete